MIVTMTADTSSRCLLAVRVLTGATGYGVTSGSSSPSLSVTPSQNGSRLYGGMHVYSGSGPWPLYVPDSGTTKIADCGGSSSVGHQDVVYRSGPSVAGSPVSVGMVPRGNEDTVTNAVLEILGSPVEDASSPPPVPSPDGSPLALVSSLATADFTPPKGSTILAIAVFSLTVNDSIADSSGLVWSNGFRYNHAVSFWLATVPAAPSKSYSAMITRSAGHDPLVSDPLL